MAKKYVITIQQGREYRAKEESIYEEDAFFFDAYSQARDSLLEILHASSCQSPGGSALDDAHSPAADPYAAPKAAFTHSTYRTLSDTEQSNRLRCSTSNIIAFCADRGQGKTSAMISFGKALRTCRWDRKQTPGGQQFWRQGPHGDAVDDLPDFQVLNSIDPTLMEEDDSILKVVISRMFEDFCERQAKNQQLGPVSSGQRVGAQDLAALFEKCFHAADMLRSRDAQEAALEDDDLERIAELSDSSNLLVWMYRLIEGYLRFVGMSEAYLVIQVDDADMNIAKGYEILEDLRRYLILPNVVILMAANMTQLESTVEQHFLEEYRLSVTIPDSMVTAERCHQIAELYLEKVIPGSRQIHLPDIRKLLQENYSLVHLAYQDADGQNILPGGDDWAYQKQLLSFVYQKTGLIFVEPEDYLHNLLPLNFRQLCHFLVYFSEMHDVSACYTDIISAFCHPEHPTTPNLQYWQENLRRFEHYLVVLWAAASLRESSRRLFMNFTQEAESSRNAFLLSSLPAYYAGDFVITSMARGGSPQEERTCREAFSAECRRRGVGLMHIDGEDVDGTATYADVMTALSVLTHMPGGYRHYKFVYGIRLYYSIFFHRLLFLLLDELQKNGGRRTNGTDSSGSETSGDKHVFRPLSYYLRDIALKDGPPGVLTGQPLFWKIPIQRELVKIPEGNRLPFRSWNYFLRSAVRYSDDIYMAPAFNEDTWPSYPKIENDDGGMDVCFSPLYPLLYELDVLVLSPSLRTYIGDQKALSRIIAALATLLNWDVMHELFHIAKTNFIFRAGDFHLYTAVQAIYGVWFHSLFKTLPEVLPDSRSSGEPVQTAVGETSYASHELSARTNTGIWAWASPDEEYSTNPDVAAWKELFEVLENAIPSWSELRSKPLRAVDAGVKSILGMLSSAESTLNLISFWDDSNGTTSLQEMLGSTSNPTLRQQIKALQALLDQIGRWDEVTLNGAAVRRVKSADRRRRITQILRSKSAAELSLQKLKNGFAWYKEALNDVLKAFSSLSSTAEPDAEEPVAVAEIIHEPSVPLLAAESLPNTDTHNADV